LPNPFRTEQRSQCFLCDCTFIASELASRRFRGRKRGLREERKVIRGSARRWSWLGDKLLGIVDWVGGRIEKNLRYVPRCGWDARHGTFAVSESLFRGINGGIRAGKRDMNSGVGKRSVDARLTSKLVKGDTLRNSEEPPLRIFLTVAERSKTSIVGASGLLSFL